MKKDNIFNDLEIGINIQKENHDNTLFGIAALFLIMTNAFLIQDLVASLTQDSNLIDRLYKPEQEMELFTVPVFIVVSLISIWLITPDATPMKKMFKVNNVMHKTIRYSAFVLLVAVVAFSGCKKL